MSASAKPSDPDPAPGGKPRRRIVRRILRRIVLGTGALVLALLLGVGGALAWIETASGHRYLASIAARSLGAPGAPAIVEGLTGSLLFHPRLARLVLADAKGGYFEAENLALDIDAGQLWRRTLRITRISAARMSLARLPAPGVTASPSPSQHSLSFPGLPVAVDLAGLDVARLDLGPAVMGKPERFAITGHARLLASSIDVHLAARGLAGDAGSDTVGGLTLDAIGVERAGRGIQVSGHAEGDIAQILPPGLRAAIGDRPDLDFAALAPAYGPVAIEGVRLDLAAATVWAGGRYDPADSALDLSLSANGGLDRLGPLVGAKLAGAVRLGGHLGGTVARPSASLNLSGSDLAYNGEALKRADIALVQTAPVEGRYQLALRATLNGAMHRGSAALPPVLGDTVVVEFDASAEPGAGRYRVASATVDGAGLAISGHGSFEAGKVAAVARIAASDLARFSALAGHPLGGAGTVDLDVTGADPTALEARLSGHLERLRLGVPAADMLAGGTLELAALASRGADGRLALSSLRLTGRNLALDAHGGYDPASRQLDATAHGRVRDLAALQPALGPGYAGVADLDATASGPLDHVEAKLDLAGDGIVAAGRRVDRLRVRAALADLATMRADVTADAVAERLPLHLEAAGDLSQPGVLTISKLVFTGPASRADAVLAIDLDRHRTAGKITARLDDLGAWSPLLGRPAGGRATLALAMTAALGPKPARRYAGSQAARLGVEGSGLYLGAGADRVALGRIALDARIDGGLDPAGFVHPTRASGQVRLDMAGVAGPQLVLSRLHFDAVSAGGQRDPIHFDAEGAVRRPEGTKPFRVAAAGDAVASAASQTLRLARLEAGIGHLALSQSRLLTLYHDAGSTRLDGLALTIAGGSLRGHALLDRSHVELALAGRSLALGDFGREAGMPDLAGTMRVDLQVAGPLAAYRGNLSLEAPNLRLAAETHPELPALGVAAEAQIEPGQLRLDATLSGGGASGRQLHLTGTVPLATPPLPAAPAPDRAGPLALRLAGAGRFEQWAAFVPLGEDRLAGAFRIDATVGGSLAHPVPSGHVLIQDGGYQNAATGLRLAGLELDAEGGPGGIRIDRLRATDSGRGTLTGRGGVALGEGGAGTIDLTFDLRHFTLVRSDQATAIASGAIAVAGTAQAPRIGGTVTVERADIDIPDRLPPSIVTLDVTRIDSRQPAVVAPAPALPLRAAAAPAAPPLSIGLAIRVDLPGQVFVRGQGLDSEWHGGLDIGGVAAAPVLVGTLEATRGTFSALSHDFTLTRGAIRFDGGARIAPSLDIQAATAAGEVTAIIAIGGTSAKPTLTLSSIPALPQDEILSRVLFGRGVGQISPAEGLALAQAAASLAGGGGPGVLDRARKATGLDRLSVNSGAGATDALGNPVAQPAGQAAQGVSATTVSGGKYVAPGVFVGFDQGAGTSTSKARVEVELFPHVNAFATAGATSEGQSLGAHYSLDY